MLKMQSNSRSQRFQIESGAGRRRLISLTPLIDVVFILLVFYMLAAAAPRWESIQLAPPVRGQAATAGPPALIVRLDSGDDRVTLEGEDLSLDAAMRRIAAVLEADPDRPVAVQPAPGVALQRVVTVLGRLSTLPVPSVSLMRGAPPK